MQNQVSTECSSLTELAKWMSIEKEACMPMITRAVPITAIATLPVSNWYWVPYPVTDI